jgi:hypothetical protein
LEGKRLQDDHVAGRNHQEKLKEQKKKHAREEKRKE